MIGHDDPQFDLEDYVKIAAAIWAIWQKRGGAHAVAIVMSVLQLFAEQAPKDKSR